MKRTRKFEVPVELIGLEENNYHLLISSTFEDGEVKYWIIDTGASKSVFNVSEAEYYTKVSHAGMQINSAGIGSNQVETSVGRISSVAFSDFVKKKFEVALIDLEQINQLYRQFADIRISGLLGSDFLVRHKAIIDYKKQILTLYR